MDEAQPKDADPRDVSSDASSADLADGGEQEPSRAIATLDTPPADRSTTPTTGAATLAVGPAQSSGSLTSVMGRLFPSVSRPAASIALGAVCATFAAAGGLALALSQGDWGSAAWAAGLASLSLGAICLIMVSVRSVNVRPSRRLAQATLAVMVAFAALGGIALGVANPVRLAQARALESNRDWPGALREYVLAGELGPSSADPARVYLEWGDDLAQRGQYSGAIDRYEQVLTRYPRANAADQRAVASLWPTYANWLAIPNDQLPFIAIIAKLRNYRQAPWCDAACYVAASLLEAQARFGYGAELMSAKLYPQAIRYFESVAATNAASPLIAPAHTAAATAYYALGQSQLHGPSCPTALPSYQTLAVTYKDTPEGKLASAALAAPVPVAGALVGYPNNPAPTMYLSRHVTGTLTSDFSDDYSAALDGSGHFTFATVTPGRYNLSAAFGDGSGRFWQDTKTNSPYAVVVAPLCAVNIGTFHW